MAKKTAPSPPVETEAGSTLPCETPTLDSACASPSATADDKPDAGATAPSADKGSGEYSVGYGKPPLETRWKKGQSGNPKGKKKGTKSVKTVVTLWAKGKITVKKNGQQKTMSNLEAQVEKLNVEGLGGDIKAAALLIGLAKQYVPEDIEPDATAKLAPEDLAILQSHATLTKFIEACTEGAQHKPDDDEEGTDE